MKRRVLFVDDEPKILEAPRRMPRTLRHEWDLAFAQSGPEALEIPSAKPFDVIPATHKKP